MRQMHLLVATIALAACQGAETATAPTDPMAGHHMAEASKFKGVAPLPVQELGKVRSATAKYHDVQAALDDDYVRTDIVIPNMGRHYIKFGDIPNGTIDLEHPEILVYQEGPGDHLKLVAVEYAVPLNLDEPEGFTGDADVWTPSQAFGLWLLHAWVWKDNPAGMFNMTNPNVP